MRDHQLRHTTLSYWVATVAVISYLKRTGDLEFCETNPHFPRARAVLLSDVLYKVMIPKERQEVFA